MSLLRDKVKSAISIPEYVLRYVDASVDLRETPKIPCLWHKENTPSMSYSDDKKVWRCFGACKTGGDVVAMHRHHMKLKDDEEAVQSLAKLLGISSELELSFEFDHEPDMFRVRYEEIYAQAKARAITIDDWLELDYIMGQFIKTTDTIELLEQYVLERS